MRYVKRSAYESPFAEEPKNETLLNINIIFILPYLDLLWVANGSILAPKSCPCLRNTEGAPVSICPATCALPTNSYNLATLAPLNVVPA